MKRRALLLVVSVLVAAVGTALIAVYVRNADNRAVEGQRLVKVLVARENIPVGTPAKNVFEDAKSSYESIQVDALGPDALTASVIADDALIGRLGPSAILIRAGTPLLQSYFPAAGAKKVQTRSGNRLVLLALSGPEQLAGLIDVGNTVTVLGTSKNPGARPEPIAASALVVSIDGSTGATGTTGTAGAAPAPGSDSTVGLSVTEAEALRLVAAQVQGIALNLISAPSSADAADTGTATAGQVQ